MLRVKTADKIVLYKSFFFFFDCVAYRTLVPQPGLNLGYGSESAES